MNKKTLFLFLIILALAAFFRFWHLAQIPPGLYPDVAMNGNNALQALETQDFKIFYQDNNGREGLFMNLIAFSFYLFDASVWSIKFVAALFGFLTVLGLFFCARTFFSYLPRPKADFIALISAFFISISFWHVNFSRLGFRAIMVPFVLVWAFYFLFKALFAQIQKWQGAAPPTKLNLLHWILAGLFFGLGFHTYISYRVAPLILLPPFFFSILAYWPKFKSNLAKKSFIFAKIKAWADGWWKWLVFFGATILAALPILIYFIQNPQDFSGRTGQVSVFASANPIKELSLSVVKTLGMFNVRGDCNWRHNNACQPELLWPIGIFFIIGLAFSLYESFRPKNFRGKKWLSLAAHWTLLFMFGAMLLPEILSMEGLPHALRAIGAIPPVMIFSALGLYLFFEALKILFFKKGIKLYILYMVMGFLLAGAACAEYSRYFLDWGARAETKAEFTQNFVEMGDYINAQPKSLQKYVVVNAGGVPVPYPDGVPMPAQTLMFISHANPALYLKSDELAKISCTSKQKCLVLFMNDDRQKISALRQKFPNSYPEEINNSFTVLKINY